MDSTYVIRVMRMRTSPAPAPAGRRADRKRRQSQSSSGSLKSCAHNASALSQNRNGNPQAAWRQPPDAIARNSLSDAIRANAGGRQSWSDEVSQMALPPASPSRFTGRARSCRPVQTISAGLCTALGRQDARRDRPVGVDRGDAASCLPPRMRPRFRHRIPLTPSCSTWRIRQCPPIQQDGSAIADQPATWQPDFVKFAESFGAAGERAAARKSFVLRSRRQAAHRWQP